MKKYKSVLSTLLFIIVSISTTIAVDQLHGFLYRPVFEKYLSERYPEPMVASSIYGYFWKGQHSCYTYLKNNPEIEFYAYVKKDKNTGNLIFSDNYFIALWENQVQNEVNESVSRIYNNLFAVYFQIYDSSTDPMVFGSKKYYRDYAPKTKVPSYHEMKKSISQEGFYRTLEIEINGEMNSGNKDAEFDKLFKTTLFLKSKDYNTDSISISYGKGSKSKNSSTFTDDTEHSYFFSEEDLKKINTISDLKKLYKD